MRIRIIEEFDATDSPEGDRFTVEEKETKDQRLDELQEKIEALYRENMPNNTRLF